MRPAVTQSLLPWSRVSRPMPRTMQAYYAGHTCGFHVFTADNKHQAPLPPPWPSVDKLAYRVTVAATRRNNSSYNHGERCWMLRERDGVEYYWEDEDFQRCNSRGLNELWKRKILLLSYKIKLFPGPECCVILDDM